MSEMVLLIMVRNAELGKVKTRLAEVIGDEKALQVYQKLLCHTADEALLVDCSRAVFYTEFIPEQDVFPSADFIKFIQEGDSLGDKMRYAFDLVASKGFERMIIIGSDCLEITANRIQEAFDALDSNEVVIGPASDGGYYLLGMRQVYPQLFEGKEWSTANVFLDTLLNVQELGLSYSILPTLNDIDTAEDLGALLEEIGE